MSVNEEIIQPTSDSFWEVDSYKRTTKRHDDGNRLSNDLQTFIQERADIEKHYAKSLKQWAKKWSEVIEKGPEYGTTEAAWKGILSEAESVAELHLTVKEKLLNEVQNALKQWRADHYHKSVMGPCKETKDLEDHFRKAQKPWAKRLVKVQKSRKDYHMACKTEKTLSVQESNSKNDSAMSTDQKKKITDKLDKCRRDVDSTKDKYEAALHDIDSYNSRYIEDMTEVFEKSQEFEEKRLKYFKEIMFGIQKCLDLSGDPQYPQIYDQLRATIDGADYIKDLKWWSLNNGVDMSMNWPQFEEYSPELHSISRKDKKGAVSSTVGESGITLMAHHQKTEAYTPTTPTAPEPSQAYDNPATTAISTAAVTSNTTALQSNGGQLNQNSQNPFGDDDWDDYDNALIDDGAPGVPVRALYDYDGAEDDELSFKVGDVFEKLRDRDDQGWCKGRKGGRVGLYPDNYVEVI